MSFLEWLKSIFTPAAPPAAPTPVEQKPEPKPEPKPAPVPVVKPAPPAPPKKEEEEEKKPVLVPLWVREAEKHKGKKETDKAWIAELAPKWKLVGLPGYKTLVGSSYAWCGLFVASMLAAAGMSYQKNGAGAKNWASYGQKIEWTTNGIPRGAILHINHSRCGSSSGNHVAFANGDCSAEDLKKSGATIALLGGNQGNQVKVSTYSVKEICAVRWPKEKPLPAKVTKSVNCSSGKSEKESTR